MSELYLGDCLAVLKTLPDSSIDSVVTDPPYGLGKQPDALAMLQDWLSTGHHDVKGKGFMGKEWDAFIPQPALWTEVMRVLKPGGHILCFAGTRTQDLMGLSLRLAGFELRDCVYWTYGSGFPKSLDVSKALDRMAGAEREVVGYGNGGMVRVNKRNAELGYRASGYEDAHSSAITAPATEPAKQWAGWGTALKPAVEPCIMARKPLIGTVAENVLAHGTGALNIDASRIPTDPSVDDSRLGGAGTWASDKMAKNVYEGGYAGERVGSSPLGRWPANLIHDGSDEVVSLFPQTKDGVAGKRSDGVGMFNMGGHDDWGGYGGGGSAARFFYCAKSSKRDRGADNRHPTVKPTDLMRYLCRLITPPGGTVLDPFMGSGSTGKAAILEGFGFIGIEREAEYLEIARARIAAVECDELKLAV